MGKRMELGSCYVLFIVVKEDQDDDDNDLKKGSL